MRIYHFLDSHYGLENISHKRLKISRIIDLNDPFELLGVDLHDQEMRSALNRTKEQLASNRGLICFSATWRNPVQWGHYADKHKGLCLGFDIPDDLLMKVTYTQKRLKLPSNIDENFMKKILSTKFTHWRYEKEYRVFLSLSNNIGGLYFKEFSNDLKLKQVIVGCESCVSRSQISEALSDYEYEVEVFKARPAFRSFKIVRQKKEVLWA